ncbi:helix-turn-helix domain-containing protein [Patescibacteria group bacterium]
MQLEDRFYTSTEVAEILGVSLRSVYRYLEDNKLNAAVKTATGRHRFTRQNILNFLYPDGSNIKTNSEETTETSLPERIAPVPDAATVSLQTSVQEIPTPPSNIQQPVTESESTEEIEEDPVDWLAKFREAASKYKEDQEPVTTQNYQTPVQPTQPIQQPQTPVQVPYQNVQQKAQPQPVQQTQPQEPSTPAPAQVPVQSQKEAPSAIMYYRSMLGGLKDIAQNLDKSARNSNLVYAFTLNAGASLHKPIKPFATLHAYVKTTDRDFFEKILRLTPSTKANAQLALVISDDSSLYSSVEEVHGLYVVSKPQLKKDISSFGDVQLAQEIADIL